MPPEDRFVCRFAAEPPQDPLPYGRWADTLQAEFLAACLKVDTEETDLGDPGSMTWFPDRTWAGRTFVPVTSRTANGLDLYGYVSFTPGDEDSEPSDFYSWADFTDETADRHPEWKMDLCEEVIGGWRGENGEVAAMTLVWGVPLVRGGAVATAELAGLADLVALLGLDLQAGGEELGLQALGPAAVGRLLLRGLGGEAADEAFLGRHAGSLCHRKAR